MKKSLQLGGIILAMGITMAGCAHTGAQATDAPDGIVMIEHGGAPECMLLGKIVGRSQGSFFYGDMLVSDAIADLRREGELRGATHIVINEIYPSAHEAQAFGTAYRCPKHA